MAARSERWSNLTFVVLFTVVVVLFLLVVWRFLLPILTAAFVVALLYPVNDFLCRKLGGRRRLAALLSTVGIFLVLVVPAAGVGYLFVQQAIDLVGRIEGSLGTEGLGALAQGEVPEALRPLAERLEKLQLGAQLGRALSTAATGLARSLASLVGATANLLLALFLGFLALYYFFADGHRIVAQILEATPLERHYTEAFLREVRRVSQAMIGVNAVTAVVHGVLGAVGFAIVRIPSPLVWGALMCLFSFVPLVGTSIVWGPAAIVLLLTGRHMAGLFLLVWGAVVVGTSDNILRPLLAKGRMDLHPLLVFVTIFGGIAAFGFLGVILGPMIGSIFTAMVRIWKRDFVPRMRGAS